MVAVEKKIFVALEERGEEHEVRASRDRQDVKRRGGSRNGRAELFHRGDEIQVLVCVSAR